MEALDAIRRRRSVRRYTGEPVADADIDRVLLLALLAPLRSKPLWNNPWLEWFGLLSYSIYMWHVPLAWTVILGMRRAGLTIPARWTIVGLLVALLVAALCLALSTLTYRWIERPFLVRKARLRLAR